MKLLLWTGGAINGATPPRSLSYYTVFLLACITYAYQLTALTWVVLGRDVFSALWGAVLGPYWLPYLLGAGLLGFILWRIVATVNRWFLDLSLLALAVAALVITRSYLSDATISRMGIATAASGVLRLIAYTLIITFSMTVADRSIRLSRIGWLYCFLAGVAILMLVNFAALFTSNSGAMIAASIASLLAVALLESCFVGLLGDLACLLSNEFSGELESKGIQ